MFISKKKLEQKEIGYVNNILELNVNIDSLDTKITKLEKEREKILSRFNELKEELISTKHSNGGFKSSNNKLIAKRDKLLLEIKELNKIIYRYEKKIKTIKKANSNLKNENEKMSIDVINLHAIIENLNKANKNKKTPEKTSDIVNYDKKYPCKKW